MSRLSGPFQKRLLVRIAAALMAVTVIILTAFAFLFSHIYVRAVRDRLAHEYERSLQAKLVELESTEPYLNDLHRTLLADPDVSFFLRSATIDPIDEFKARNILRRTKALSPDIHSFALCNSIVDWCISTVLPSATSEEFLTPVPHISPDIRRLAVPQTIAVPQLPSAEVVSLYYFSGTVVDSPSGSLVRSVIVINLIDQFDVEQDLDSSVPFFAVLDENMRLVGRDADVTMSPGTNELSELIAEAPQGGEFEITLHGRPLFVSYLRSELLGWTLLRIDSDEELRGEIVAVRNQIFWGVGAAFLFASALVLFLSRRVYSPVDALMRKIRESHSVAVDNSNGELSLILNSLSDLTEQISQLEQERSKDRETLRKEFLSRLCRESVNVATYRSARHRLRLQLGDSDFLVVVVHPESVLHGRIERSSVLLTGLVRVVADALSGFQSSEVFRSRPGEVCAVLSEVHAIPDHELQTRLEDVSRSARSLLRVDLCVGIGSTVESPAEISESYTDASGIVDHALTLPGAWVHTRASLVGLLKVNPEYPSGSEHALETALRVGDEVEFGDGVAAIVDALDHCPFVDSIMILSRLTIVLVHSSNELLASVGRDPLVETRAANTRLSGLESLDEWRRWMLDLYTEVHIAVREASSGKRESEVRALVSGTIDYLEHNFADPGLYGESVASHFGYSPSHFAKIFRDATGRSVADHLREYRISKAKELLSVHSRTTVKEVARAVGFANINYFYQVFKKMVGVTPSVYKELPTSHAGQRA